jgi:hypothetical protein
MVDKTVSFCGYVECTVPHEGILKLGEKYTVVDETENGYTLYEVEPPKPFTTFHKNRFKVLNEKNYELLSSLETESLIDELDGQ